MRATLAVLLLAAAALGNVATARQVVPPDDFSAAVALFEAERYEDAARAFEPLIADPSSPWASAAFAMQGKALYRAARYRDAEVRLRAFLAAYPDSKYAPDVRATLDLARAAISVLDQRARPLGVALSLQGEEAAQTQALFNGIRMAVDEHNRTATGRERIRIVFRDIGSEANGAALAVGSLADEGVSVIVGALFSEQAREAAAAAELRRVTLLAPLATDDRVSKNRTFVFQANPTIQLRGKLMARFAVNGLLLRRFGVLAGYDGQGVSTSMAEAFEDEARELGAEVVLVRSRTTAADWQRVADLLPADTLKRARALFVPLTGRSAERQAHSLVQALKGLSADVRILGNAEWNQVRIGADADPFAVTFTNDFLVRSENPGTAAFLREYRRRYGTDAGRLAHVGYDVIGFLVSAISSAESSLEIANAIRGAAPYEGTGMRIDFRGGQVNEAMFYQRLRDGRIEVLR